MPSIEPSDDRSPTPSETRTADGDELPSTRAARARSTTADGDELPSTRAARARSTTAALAPSSARLAGTMLANLRRSPRSRREALAERHAEVAEQTVEVLGKLRGGAMKLGQLASFVDVEFLPEEHREIYREKLGRLRDAAPAMSWAKVERVLAGEWERPISELFRSLEEEAVAAASIGQVHRGVLADGRRVAVKVQYPEIADALAADLELAAVAIGLGKAFAPGLDPHAVAGELRERVLEELDFELEAQHQRTFARAYRGHPFIYVPPVISALSRRRVLVSEWVDGARFEEILGRDQEERNRVGEIIVRFFFGSKDRIHRLNTDPHPGNYLLMDDGRMAFLDFGNTIAIRERARERSRVAMRAAIRGDADGLARAASKMGYVRSLSTIDRELLLAQARLVADWYLEDRELRIDPEYVAGILRALLDRRITEGTGRLLRQMKIPPEELWLRRVEMSVLAVLGRLRARRNWHRIMVETLGTEPVTDLGLEEAAFWARPGGRAARRR